jgi:hypothetical protein
MVPSRPVPSTDRASPTIPARRADPKACDENLPGRFRDERLNVHWSDP